MAKMIHQFTYGMKAFGKLWDLVKENWITFLHFHQHAGTSVKGSIQGHLQLQLQQERYQPSRGRGGHHLQLGDGSEHDLFLYQNFGNRSQFNSIPHYANKKVHFKCPVTEGKFSNCYCGMFWQFGEMLNILHQCSQSH